MTILLHKPLGLTPLQAIDKLRQKHPRFKSNKIGYAGRLDPMAEGLLLLLMDEENKDKHKYEALAKTYRFTILWGVETDTYDILGEITRFTGKHPSTSTARQIVTDLARIRKQKYPPYSSARVQGKPLYWWARRNKISEIKLPEKEIKIYEAKYCNDRNVTANDLSDYIQTNIDKVKGDFRQEKIKSMWEQHIASDNGFLVSSAEITCSSGTYIRSLCNEAGNLAGTGAIAYSINRIAIGENDINSDILKIDEDKETH